MSGTPGLLVVEPSGAYRLEADAALPLDVPARGVFEVAVEDPEGARTEASVLVYLAPAGTVRWTGATSSDVSDANNWAPAATPDEGVAVLIAPANNPATSPEVTLDASELYSVAGESLSVSRLIVHQGRALAAGPVLGISELLVPAGTTGELAGEFERLTVRGSTRAEASVRVHTDLVLTTDGTGTGAVAHFGEGRSLVVNGLLRVDGTGLRLTTGAVVDASDVTLLPARDHDLQEGQLRVRGALVVDGDALRPPPGFVVTFAGIEAQRVAFEQPGASCSPTRRSSGKQRCASPPMPACWARSPPPARCPSMTA